METNEYNIFEIDMERELHLIFKATKVCLFQLAQYFCRSFLLYLGKSKD